MNRIFSLVRRVRDELRPSLTPTPPPPSLPCPHRLAARLRTSSRSWVDCVSLPSPRNRSVESSDPKLRSDWLRARAPGQDWADDAPEWLLPRWVDRLATGDAPLLAGVHRQNARRLAGLMAQAHD